MDLGLWVTLSAWWKHWIPMGRMCYRHKTLLRQISKTLWFRWLRWVLLKLTRLTDVLGYTLEEPESHWKPVVIIWISNSHQTSKSSHWGLVPHLTVYCNRLVPHLTVYRNRLVPRLTVYHNRLYCSGLQPLGSSNHPFTEVVAKRWMVTRMSFPAWCCWAIQCRTLDWEVYFTRAVRKASRILVWF